MEIANNRSAIHPPPKGRGLLAGEDKAVFSFKVKVHGSEVVEVTLTGDSASAVAALANRLKAALDVRIDNKQYKQSDKTTEESKNSTDDFETLLNMFGLGKHFN